MSSESYEGSISQTDRKRRMSLKGPPLRVAVKQTTASTPQQTKQQPSAAPQSRPSLAGPSLSDRRQSLSARALAKAPVSKPLVATAAPVPRSVATQPAPVREDPMLVVNQRLDAMEKQISELQTMMSKITALEELVRPLKTSITTLEGDVAELASNVKCMSDRPASKSIVQATATNVTTDSNSEEQVQSEGFVQEFLDELDQSLDSGEIDLEEYGHSLRSVLGKGGLSTREIPMTSTPPSAKISAHSKTAAKPFSIPSSAVLAGNTPIKPSNAHMTAPYHSHSGTEANSKTSSMKPALQYERTPIKRTNASNSSFSTNEHSNPPSMHSSMHEGDVENLSHNLAAVEIPKDVTPVKQQPMILMENIKMEEKANVTLWLGLDINELNRAITLLNDLAMTIQTTPGFNAMTCKEISFTMEEVASHCTIETKKAKALVLLLCGLKRLRLVRGETTSYILLTGNSLVKA